MSGHSKWATIKRKKGANDAIRGAMTTKISREITIAVKMGGADPTGNMRLKLALSKAKANNVTKENINRAIQKGLGASDTSNYEEITYEGYGPGGAALMLDILTDNRNRTAANIRHIFSKHGGNLGENGCVAWMFKKKAVFTVDKETFDDEDTLMEIAMDAGAEDFIEEDDSFTILTSPEDFSEVRAALESAGIPMADADIQMIPQNYVDLANDDDINNLNRILDLLDEDDDVQEVFHNWNE